MNRENNIYQKQLEVAIKTNNLEKLHNKTIMITGATGLIGSCIIDVLMKENELKQANIGIIAMARDIENAKVVFGNYLKERLCIVKYEALEKLNIGINTDYIIHAASNAHPKTFSLEPVNTINGNLLGTNNILEYAIKNNTKRVLFVSSGEIYGQGSSDIQDFVEDYRGYIDCTSIRACYPISKQAAENLCIAYSEQYGIETVIARPCHVYGPSVTEKDSRAYAQFLRNGINGENIVMKSKGEQYRSYCYVVDCATGILKILLEGKNKNAYNIANKDSNITIYELAQTIAKYSKTNVIIENPDIQEQKGYNPVTRSVLNANKLEKLGWNPVYKIENGIEETIKILKDV